MRLRKTTAIFSIIVGLAMMGIWIMLLISGQDPQLKNELKTIPFSISLAIASDFLTALALLSAGIGLLSRRKWAGKALLLALGFLFYSVVNALGLYGQRGELPFIIMFIVILVLAIIFTVLAFREESSSGYPS